MREPDDEQHVGLARADQVAGRPEAEDRSCGWSLGTRRAAGHRRQHRAAEQLDDLQQRLVGAGAIDPAARDDHRPLRRGEERDSLVELRGGGLRTGPAGGARRDHAHALLVVLLVEDRRRQLDVHRPGPAVPHLAEGEPQHLGDARPFEDRAAPLHGRAEELELVLSLEGRGRRRVDDAEPVLGGDHEHRHALVPGGDHPRQQVRRARARGCRARPRPCRSSCRALPPCERPPPRGGRARAGCRAPRARPAAGRLSGEGSPNRNSMPSACSARANSSPPVISAHLCSSRGRGGPGACASPAGWAGYFRDHACRGGHPA